ncbi:uncharacterized protein LOC115732650 isoform X2 [Rhodamnia argentea]|uniref:Uncharacterized protein LOC115732650 isoform X2 n=1 Tax=Rhodamnia argentea TaxID=178133 RepID=A0ABM3HK17_9MYRT|nr:uncharacterized protein LOC115732650 isoform X2 [Rhodamnia argentea]
MANPAFDDLQGEQRIMSDAPPAHYIVKIEAFSSLSKNSVGKYESGVFQAGGYKWKLVLYPNGNTSKNVKEHVSLYLSTAETSSFPPGWEVHASVRFFLLDQDKDSYMIIQDDMRKEWRFHGMKIERGFDQFIPLKTLNDARNGYLVDDTCVFGAEVFVTRERSTGKGENLSMVKDRVVQKCSWKIDNFSKLDKEFSESKVFIAGNQKWKLRLYPKGKGTGLGTSISLYVVLADAYTLPPGAKVLADFSVRIVDQLQGRNFIAKANHWFSASSQESGWAEFISHATFYYPKTGTLWYDTCLVEVEVAVLGMVNAL